MKNLSTSQISIPCQIALYCYYHHPFTQTRFEFLFTAIQVSLSTAKETKIPI